MPPSGRRGWTSARQGRSAWSGREGPHSFRLTPLPPLRKSERGCPPSAVFGEGAGGRGSTGGTMRTLAVISVLALAGCAGKATNAPDLLPPEVTLTQIGMRNFGLTGGTLDTKVTLRNPNS